MYHKLAHIAQSEFSDIIPNYIIFYGRGSQPLKLRLYVCDGTLIDVWISPDQSRYSYHWEQRVVRGVIHRHDNAPDHPTISTHPKHFHDGSEHVIRPSTISDHPPTALREFLTFVRKHVSP